MSEPTVPRSQSQPQMDITQMYKIATRENTAWGIEGYQVPKKYNDHIKSRKQAEIDEMIKNKKKPGWPAQKATKRGNFIEDHVKIHNPTHPNPNKIPSQYKLQDPWVMKEEVKKNYAQKNKVDMKADKNTYIAAIYKKQAKEKTPAPGVYNVTKTQEQIEQEKKKLATRVVKYGELPNYLNDFEWQGNQNPGPGQYNGKVQQKDTFEWENKKKFLTGNVYYSIEPKEWIKKHNKKTPKIDMSEINPFPVSYDTFGKKLLSAKEGKDKSGVKYWGTTKRIYSIKEEVERDKKLKRIPVPGAGTYGLIAKWPESKPSKNDKKPKSKTQTFNYNRISKGTESTRSIYY